jgi:hypothetical protein
MQCRSLPSVLLILSIKRRYAALWHTADMSLYVSSGLFLLWNLNVRGFRIQDITSLKFMRGVREACPFYIQKSKLTYK